ncbi:3'(2'),5'-bisphosphate nucleotidase CysQ [Idiomarina seosinensis]|uniref:3'(2'),5'-bisphosphate nucleotidase CysQ n=1 Tax=Idiomarina seosinensis TaxID=281739 RepID=UPI00384ECF3B
MLDIIRDIAREAGALIMQAYQQGDFATYTKADESPVTSTDVAASELIISRLQQHFPDIPVLSEESDHENFSERKHWQRYFLIDPIDGTQEFISRSGDFAVNIALIEDHQPRLGVIYWPVGDSLYFARRDHGAFKQCAGVTESIQVRQLDNPQQDPLIIAMSRRQAPAPILNRVQTERQLQMLSAGSCSLKSCFIAEGKADCFLRLGPTGEWDTAAAEVIVSEAGGSLVNENFDPITYNQTVSLLNPNFFVLGDPRVDWQQVFIAHQPHFR